MIGNPGTGKTHLTGIALAHSLYNSLISYVTSFASRRAKILRGEHIHRLFKISVRSLDAESLANEAVVKLNHDHKRRSLLLQLQVLIFEEVSLVPAELFCAMDLILRKIKNSNDSFGGALVIANGDCCQLPNISGKNIFEACSFLFTFDFHFLQHFVRMIDPAGQRLLTLLEKRPVATNDIAEILNIISTHCRFVKNWDDLSHLMIMKVFGKREAERKAIKSHFNDMKRVFSASHTFIKSCDEISTEGSHSWRATNGKVLFLQ